MPILTNPLMLDSTGQRQADALEQLANVLTDAREEAVPSKRVISLEQGKTLANSARIVEHPGAPTYVSEDDLSDYSDFGLTESGWYVFARILAKPHVFAKSTFALTGAAFITPSVGDVFVDVAVKFTVAAETVKVAVNWGDEAEDFYFKATDLAVRNMDYRVTFYQYDLAPYCTWTWAVASGTFQASKSYYTRTGTEGAYEYTKATVTTGQTIPANTYYTHSALTISGFVKNISYMLDEIDCPVTINLPAVEENYGAWFEVQTKFLSVYSITLNPVSPDKVAGNHVQSPKAGVDIINLMYHKPTKTWLPTITNWAAGV